MFINQNDKKEEIILICSRSDEFWEMNVLYQFLYPGLKV